METETKINKWDLIRLISSYIVKETIKKAKDNQMSGRKYLQMIQPTGFNFQNRQTVHIPQQQKTNNLIKNGQET